MRGPIALGLVGLLILAVVAPASASASATDVARRDAAPTGVQVGGIRRILQGLNSPVVVTHAGDARLFVAEKIGRIRIARKVNGTWRITGTFLDVRDKVGDHLEQGLLGLAFHPGYSKNGRFYVYYANPAGDRVLTEYRRAASNPAKANPRSARVVLTVEHTTGQHNAGWLGFKGQYLYIATGDGGGQGGPNGDPDNNGQRLSTLLGKILRIDPLDPDGGGPQRYRNPADNPFVGIPGRDEIWAFGLRNPWRNGFDPITGELWVADVGQSRYEEVNRAGTGKGRNFGWKVLEGRHLYPSGDPCTTDCATLPIVEYAHEAGDEDNCAVTGGTVSRRTGAALYGHYLFGDYCSGRIWSIPADFAGGPLPEPVDTSIMVSSFGAGFDGRIYVMSITGSVYSVAGT